MNTATPMEHRKALEEHHYDVVVVGGGLAGLCAALASARNGARTAIVQDRPVFGGNSSSEVRVVPYGSTHGAAFGSETGIVHELILEDRATNHEWFFDHGLMNSMYDLTLLEAVRRQEGLTAYVNTSVRGVVTEPVDVPGDAYDRRITAVQASQLGSEKELLLTAEQFVDATGDATVGALAGAETRYGREARSEFGEPLAPTNADDVTLGSTITMRARKGDQPAPYTPPPWIAQYTSPGDFIMDRRLYHIEKENFGGFWWLEVNDPFHQIDDNAAVREELHRHVLGVWNYLKNHSPEKERFSTYVLDWIGMIPGKRESRRLVGDVTVTEQDCHNDRHWPDGIAYASWWIDLHIKGGINNREAPGERENIDKRYSDYIRLAPFSLPLRAFYSRTVQNLWMAGRSLSVSHVALGPVRVQVSLAAQGQAVGTAAAWAHHHGATPRQTADPEGQHIQPLRQLLIRQDARLLDVVNTDPTDVARTATVTASSSRPLVIPTLDTTDPARVRWLALDTDRAQVIPLTEPVLTGARIWVRNTGGSDVEVPVSVEQLGRIWDREHGKPVASATAVVPVGHEGWIDVPLGVKVTPAEPHRIILRATPGIEWATGWPLPIGTVAQYLTRSPGGCEPQNAHLEAFSSDEVDIPAYELWRQFRKGVHIVEIEPTPRPYEPGTAVNGRAWVEGMPNLWLSEPVTPETPQWLQLDWDAPQTFASVQVSFDTDLDAGVHQRPAFHRPPRAAKRWRLRTLIDDAWQTVHEEDGNVQRQRVINLEAPVTSSALRLEILETHGTDGVGVYEVRVHAA